MVFDRFPGFENPGLPYGTPLAFGLRRCPFEIGERFCQSVFRAIAPRRHVLENESIGVRDFDHSSFISPFRRIEA